MLSLRFTRRRHSVACEVPRTRCRIVVMGSPKTGKTELICRFLYKKAKQDYIPTVEDMHHGLLEADGRQHLLDILDTSGTNEFPAMRQLSITKADVFILVFSWRDPTSLDEVMRLKAQIVKERGSAVPILVVATDMSEQSMRKNLIQVDRKITEAVITFDWGLSFFDAKSLDGTSVKEVFTHAVALTQAPRKRLETM